MKNLLAFLLLPSILLLGNGKPTAIDQEIMNLSMNYEFEEADKLLAEYLDKGESLKNHFLYLSIELMKIMKTADEVPFSKRRETKEQMNNVLIQYAEDVVDKYEDEELSLYDRFYMGSIHGVLGRLHGVNRSWMSAFSEGKAGRNMMLDIIEEKPDFTDAYLLVGMMNYYADRMGGITEFIASILGLSGDRTIGLTYLQKVEKDGDINNWQATMILVELYSRMEGNKFKSIPLLEKMIKRFPQNSKFVNWLCYDYLNLQQYNKVGDLIEKDKINQISDFTKASYYHGIGKYEKSNKLYSTIMNEKDKTWPWVYENAKFTRAANYFYLNDTLMTKKYSEELNEMYSTFFDTLKSIPDAAREIEEFLIAVNIDDENYISQFLSNSPNYSKSTFLESQFYFHLGVNKYKNKLLDEAEEMFLKSKEINPEYFGERAAQYLIDIYKQNTVDIEKVEKLLDEIDDFDNERLEFFAQDLEEKYDL